MDRAEGVALRKKRTGAAARGRDDSLEARLENPVYPLGHPVFDSVRPWLERIGSSPSLERLNSFSEEQDLRTESGRPIRFVAPSASDPYYEVHLFETGLVQTRPGNWHDLFNALVWLAFPRTKARINAMHAAEIPREGGKRGRRRDLITILDEGGALFAAAPASPVESLVRRMDWRALFMEHAAEFRIVVLGHATMEQALAPHPGITCKALFVDPSRDLDAQAAEWLANAGSAPAASPKDLQAVPIFGYPGWYPGNGVPDFYANARYFRPFNGLRTGGR